jgi:hypothetical protein
MIQGLLAELDTKHFPARPATEDEIARFERRVGWKLDPDLRAFYRHCNGAKLFRERWAPYELLPLDRILRARVAMRDEDSDAWGPASLYVICYVEDGDYVAVDTSRPAAGFYPLLDLFHETFPDPADITVISDRFAEFLARALHSGGGHFWLQSKT